LKQEEAVFDVYMKGVEALFTDPAVAIASFTETIRRTSPGEKLHADAFSFRGMSFEDLGEITLATADFAQVARLDPDEIEELVQSGWVLPALFSRGHSADQEGRG
jgi:hypothetical protein